MDSSLRKEWTKPQSPMLGGRSKSSEPVMTDVETSTDHASKDACYHKYWQVYEIELRLAHNKHILCAQE